MTSSSAIFQRYAFVSLGANLDSSFGSPQDSIKHAISKISEFSQEPLLISSLIQTAPLDCPPGSPTFVNGLVGLIPQATETPLSLLKRLQEVENLLGRTRSGLVNEARVLDLDLITFKEEVSKTAVLMLPHPRATIRAFVLEPLLQLTGNVIFPGQTLFLKDLLALLKA